MVQESIPDLAKWCDAYTLRERLTTLRKKPGIPPDEAVNVEQMKKRLQHWRSQYPFTNDSVFLKRLAAEGITEEEFKRVLGVSAELIAERESAPPQWLSELCTAFGNPGNLGFFRSQLPDASKTNKTSGFLNTIAPLIDHGQKRIEEGLKKLASTSDDMPFENNTAVEALLSLLREQLLQMVSQTLALEMQISGLQGLLEGATSEEQYESFLRLLSQPDKALAILEEYPVLARQVVTCINNWVSCSVEFLQRLCEDWPAIIAKFNASRNPGVLTVLAADLRYRHRGGHLDLTATFSSGFRIIYRARSLAVDQHFQDLAGWVSERGDFPAIRKLQLLDRSTYGWVEFVDHQTCKSPEEVTRFYERLGGYIALLYLLEGNEFNFESMVAAGEHPMLMDLHALFHQHLIKFDRTRADQKTTHDILYSVLSTKILPRRAMQTAESDGVFIGALGTKAGQLTPHGVPVWTDAGTNKMRLTRQRMEMRRGRNQPALNGNDIEVLDYAGAITKGFAEVYRLLINKREELLAPQGPIACFADDEIEVVLRPPQVYYALLQDSFHPDLMRNALDRDRFFDQLWASSEYSPYLEKAIPVDRDALHNGDLPFLTSYPCSKSLWHSADEYLADFFEESGMDLVMRRIRQLSNDDLERQLWIIRASLTTLSPHGDAKPLPVHKPEEQKLQTNRDKLLVAARAVGDRLSALAVHGTNDSSWMGLTLSPREHWYVSALELDLYSGLPGVTLFLAYLGRLTEDEHYTGLARSALVSMEHKIDQQRLHLATIGAFTGWGGIIYSYTHLGALWQRLDLLQKAESFAKNLGAQIERDMSFDIMSGAAGAIAALLSLYRMKPSTEILKAAIRCGDHLLGNAKKLEIGLGWQASGNESKPMIGFARGAAGIAWALLQLAEISGEERFKATALQAIMHERSGLRHHAEASGYEHQDVSSVHWCRGAAGIGLARLQHLSQLDDTPTRAEIDAALQTTLEQGFGSSHCLCHGDLGNLELFVQAAEILNDHRWQEQVERLTASILGSIEQHGWQCGVPMQVETPGLMCGLAGIGYGLLRLAEPKHVPSVLLLEAPQTNSGFMSLSRE